MTIKLWQFSALDTYFFRDGTPFQAGEGGQAAIAGRFPPFISTLQGAIRTALAYGQGWHPNKQQNWPPQLGTPDDLGDLRLKGPYLLINDHYLLPAPLFLLQHETTGEYTRLTPGDKLDCDLGHQILPVPHPPLPGAKTLDNKYLTTSDLETVLNQGLPQSNQPLQSYWHMESRVGLERQVETRTAQETKLYSCRQVRPHHDLKIVVEAAGVPPNWHQNLPPAVPLGGEGRWARLEIKNKQPILPAPPKLKSTNGKVKYLAILITPGCYIDTKKVILHGPPGLPGRCITACIGKTLQVGGWDLKNNVPRPLAPLLPAGSTWFFETEQQKLDEIISLHGQCLGDDINKTHYGYGQIIIGCWGNE